MWRVVADKVGQAQKTGPSRPMHYHPSLTQPPKHPPLTRHAVHLVSAPTQAPLPPQRWGPLPPQIAPTCFSSLSVNCLGRASRSQLVCTSADCLASRTACSRKLANQFMIPYADVIECC